MRRPATFSLFMLFSITVMSPAQASSWVEENNEHAQIVLNF